MTSKAKKRRRAKVDPETGQLPILLVRWDAPDYAAIIKQRLENLDRLRAMAETDPTLWQRLKAYYKTHVDDFINDWGWTYDPRNADIGLPTFVPMVLFPAQREAIKWMLERWQKRERGLWEKSRDVGASWIAVSVACSLCLFYDGVAVGMGSRKAEYVDDLKGYKALFPKARIFMRMLPPELRGGWVEWRDAPYMKMIVPDTQSVISGEAGDDIGRGDRTTMYLVDEYAHFARAEQTEASLAATTNCRIDMSSVKGMDNEFARKRHSGKVNVHITDWRDDPRKNDEWYKKQEDELDPVVVAQEIDRDYTASVTGIVIPQKWAKAAVDARTRLGIAPAGKKGLALDVADEGTDKNALCANHGVEILWTRERSGKGSDLFETTQWAIAEADNLGVPEFDYDADGLGAAVRGDAKIINEARRQRGLKPVRAVAFRGSEAVVDPEGVVEGTVGDGGDGGRTNEDYYLNRASQSWFNLRRLFRNTYRWVEENRPCDPMEIISISSADPEHKHLLHELSQATFKENLHGRIGIDKKPKGRKSPNRADAVRMRFAQKAGPSLEVSGDLIASLQRRTVPMMHGRGRR